MKKKTVHRHTHKSTKRVVHHYPSAAKWDKDRGMVILLAAGTIVLVVIGMYMAGWL